MSTLFTRQISIRIVSVIFLTVFSVASLAQEPESCAEKLKTAQSSFNKGQIDQIPFLLKGCLKSGFTREEELSAFKLLIQTYLLNDQLEQADSSMLVFLKRNPEYQLSPTDHSSFVYLYNNFEVKSLVTISVRAGTNKPYLTFADENLLSGAPVTSDFRSDVTNLYLSVAAKFRFADRLEAGIEIGYSQLQFTNNIDYTNIGMINYSESQQRLEIPVGIIYEIKKFGNFTVYARGGAGAALNLSTTADASLFVSDRVNNDRTGESLKRSDSRRRLDMFIQYGGGIKYKIPRGYFFAEIRTGMGLMNQNVPGGSTVDLLENWYLWSDPDFRLNTLNLNVGWTYIFYKPSKRGI